MTEPTGWPLMLPCPFCGGAARHDAHADDCYFILHRKFKNSGADMSPAFEVLAAWNRRALQPTPTPQADSAPLAAPADTVVLEAALRAIHQAIDLIGEPDTERLRTVRRVLRGAVVVAEDSSAPQADSQPAPDEIINMAREQGLPETETEGVFIVNVDDLCRVFAAYRAARAPADSVTTPAGGAVAGPVDDLAELALLNRLIELGSKAACAHATSNSDDGHKGTAAYVEWQELRAEMGELIRTAYAAAPTPPAPADSVREDADPLQGAANWLAEAHGQFCVAVLQGCLMIGYNRAKRLHDAAIAARKPGGAT